MCRTFASVVVLFVEKDQMRFIYTLFNPVSIFDVCVIFVVQVIQSDEIHFIMGK